MKYIYLFLQSFFVVFLLHSQTPSDDKNWTTDFIEDLTNSNVLGDNLFQMLNCDNNGGSDNIYMQFNVHVSNDGLHLQINKNGQNNTEYVDNTICPCTPYFNTFCCPTLTNYEYTSAEIESGTSTENTLYRYGYFEISCICPAGSGFWPAFWLQSGAISKGNYNEIDVFEMWGNNTTNQMCTLHDNNNNIVSKYNIPCADYSTHPHTYAIEWQSDKITWYDDNKNILYLFPQEENNAQNIIVNLGTTPDCNNCITDRKHCSYGHQVNQQTKFPSDMIVAHVSHYNLLMDVNSEINQSNFDFNNYNFGVKKSITLDNTVVPLGTDIILRATDFIELNAGFEVPVGATIGFYPTPYYVPYGTTGSKCINNYTFPDNNIFNNGDNANFQANNSITAGGNNISFDLKSGSSVNLKAGNIITLKPGFHAESGSSFNAKIEKCQ